MGGVVLAELFDRWRDTGPSLWLVAGTALAVWLVTLGWWALRTEPRRVRPGAGALEVGPEPPALVNLITSDWSLGLEAVPATLLDLGARRWVSIDEIGNRTLVRARQHGTGRGPLTPYEQKVFDHLARLGAHTADGYVPADALTTGDERQAEAWWRSFRTEVYRDARARGLSTARWPAAARIMLAGLGVVVAVLVGLAASTLPSDADDDPFGAFATAGAMTAIILVGASGVLRGERDTPAGRTAAARWLGLRDLLAEDPVFSEQPPAAVAIWERHLAYGAALGVAHGAVLGLPLGTESEREAWSPVTGRWRVVRIRYPNRLPPGYGRHPLLVAFVGLVITTFGVVALPAARAAVDGLRDLIDESTLRGVEGTRFPTAFAVAIAVAASVAIASLAVGISMFVAGAGDLVRGRTDVEGRVLRFRQRGSDNQRYWHAAVDDGSRDRVRAWRLGRPAGIRQGATVRARVSPWLAHVADVTEVSAPDHGPETVDAEEDDRATAVGSTATSLLGVFGALFTAGSVQRGRPASSAASGPGPDTALGAGTSPALGMAPTDEWAAGGPVPAPVTAGLPPPVGPAAPGSPPPPVPVDGGHHPLPSASAVSALVGRSLHRDESAAPHPLALEHASSTYVGANETRVQVSWVAPEVVDGQLALPGFIRRDVAGVGDVAVGTRFGGGVVARRHGHAVLVSVHLPGAGDDERDRAAEAVAAAALEPLT